MSEVEPTPAQAEQKQFPNPLVAFLMAIQFLVVSPNFISRLFTPAELGRAVAFFPWVGALLGLVLMGLNSLLALLFPPEVRAALLLVAWVVLTGALHLDGFLDSCDGLLGGFTPEDRLKIMKDERVGAFALAGGLLLFLVKWSAVSALPAGSIGLLLAAVLGRWGMTLAIYGFPYARPQGLGRAMKDHTTWRELAFASLSALVVAGLAGGVRGLLAAALAAGLVWLAARFTLRRIPGLTGDSYGAVNELVEAAVLLVFVAGLNL